MSETATEYRFHTNTIDLIKFFRSILEELKANEIQIPLEPKTVDAGIVMVEMMEPNLVIDYFIQYSYPYWDNILEKDKSFFIEHSDTIFNGLPEDKIKQIENLFVEDQISEENLKGLWKFSESLVKIAIKHIHKRRGPINVEGVIKYKENYFPIVKIKDTARKWGVVLN